MPLDKQNVSINFAQGLDTKSDEKQVQMGKFLSLENSIFQKAGLLQKRNGFQRLTSLPVSTVSTQSVSGNELDYDFLTTFNDNLTAVGANIAAYSSGSASWVTRGKITPVSLDTLPLIRNSVNQSQCDAAVAENGLTCVVYTETTSGTSTYKYAILDSITGQSIVAPTVIPASGGGTVAGSPRVFLVKGLFVIVYTNLISAAYHLRYISIPSTSPTNTPVTAEIAASITSFNPDAVVPWDAKSSNNCLYVSYYTSVGGDHIKITYLSYGSLSTGGSPVTPISFTGVADIISLCTDDYIPQSPNIYVSFCKSPYVGSFLYVCIVDVSLNAILAPTAIHQADYIANITAVASNKVFNIFIEITNTYGYDSAVPSNYIIRRTITLGAVANFNSVFSSGAGSITATNIVGTLSNNMYLVSNSNPANLSHLLGVQISSIAGAVLTLSHNTTGNSLSSPGDYITAAQITVAVASSYVMIRGVGLASKAFLMNDKAYFLAVYGGTPSNPAPAQNQPSYFLIDATSSTAASPAVVAKLAYQNASSYLSAGLPSVTVMGSTAQVSYLAKDLIATVNKGTNNAAGIQTAQIYSQTGINLATFDFTSKAMDTAEIGSALHLSGGLLWMYDGYLPVEHGFLLYPDSVEATKANTGGTMLAATYYYQAIYEWTDNQGNIHRSAPSVPVFQTTTGTTSKCTVNIPTLRLTYKTANPIKVTLYRWSTLQTTYYQVGTNGTNPLTSPVLNDPTVDYVTFVDTLPDASIIGNPIIYTNGGVIENIAAPACAALALFKSRLFLIDAEDRNLLWFSKQVIEATPVEMSDLLTLYTSPSIGAQGSTGVSKSLAAMDDKLIVFKKDAAYYITGTGPDNTGANNDFSDPVYITSTVGCSNQKSIIFIPQGLMFESDKGIWLLGRDLSTSYIGAPVEKYTEAATVLSAVSVPGTNQVRFTMSSGITLMYDYYFQQWGTFVNIPAISSTLFQGLHTYIDTLGQVFQEKVGSYMDGSNPVLMSFETSWFNLTGLQGFERAYEFYFLGEYVTPHKLSIGIAYDYAPYPEQTTLVTPDNYSAPWGGNELWGSDSPWGGPASLEQWRIHFDRQKCQAFKIIMTEVYDPSYNVPAGAGFTLSGLDMTVGLKSKRPKLPASRQTG